MYVSSSLEQKCYYVSKRYTPSDNVPLVGLAPSHTGAVRFALSTNNLSFDFVEVNSTSVLLGPGANTNIVNKISPRVPFRAGTRLAWTTGSTSGNLLPA
jgi:hypothetical protein